jgi:hypothetical protein
MAKKLIVLIVFCISGGFADDSISAKQSAFFTPQLSVSYRIPVLKTERYWNPYAAAGLHLVFPSTIPQIQCIARFEVGRLYNHDETKVANCAHFLLGIQYNDLLKKSIFSLSPQIGITNMTESVQDVSADFFRHIFRDVENEFGFNIGVSPNINYKHLRLSLPLQFEKTLSSPERFNTITISLYAGYLFDL